MDSCTVRGTVVDRIVAIKFWQFEQKATVHVPSRIFAE